MEAFNRRAAKGSKVHGSRAPKSPRKEKASAAGAGEKPLYKPFKSTAKGKKYSVYVMKGGKKTLIHFGASAYGQFRDKLGHFKHLDHGDEQRRRSYHARHGKATDKNTAKYWAHKILW